MKGSFDKPVFDREDYYESISRAIHWICLLLVLATFPFDSQNGLVLLVLIIVSAVLNGLRYFPAFTRHAFLGSRINWLAIDHVFILALVVLSGGLASPYYPFFFLIIVAFIASYGVAGFAISLSLQLVITLALLTVDIDPQPNSREFQFVIKLAFLVLFSLVAEQSVRSRDEEHLLSNRFTRRIENERQRLLSLINSLSNAVLAIDAAGKVYLYNAAALALLNTNRDIQDESINELLPLRDAKGHKVNPLHLIKTYDHAVNRQDLFYEPGDGSRIVLDLTVSPVHVFGYGKNDWGGYMAVFSDITKQKSLDEERNEFISVTSHELRTPLAIAEANLSTALLPSYAKLDPKARTLITQAHDNIVFLSDLIADLGTLAKAERGDLKIRYNLVNTADFANQLIRDYHAGAHAKHLDLRLEMPAKPANMVTSESELHEILQNFLTNAIKYTAKGGITLQIKDTDAGTELSVNDSGIGISAGDKTQVFEKFWRSEDYRTRQTGGTGLGLYITHKLADKLGATISFSSRLDQGSTFRVLVPKRSLPADPPSKHPSGRSKH